MATNLEYRSSFVDRSWALPIDPDRPYRKVVCGFWLHETIDRCVDIRSAGTVETADVYRSLQSGQIRVFTLHAGRKDEPLTGHLETLHISDAKDAKGYEALSYVWGQLSFSEELSLAGGTVGITPNLAEALHHLQSPTEARRLWVDAICINQKDNEERAWQVQMMTDIYQNASRNVAWLGAETEHSAVGMAVMREFSQGVRFGVDEKWQRLPPSVVRPALEDFIGRAYFTRLWIIQEAAVAREVVMIIGHQSFSWRNTIGVVLRFMRSIKMAVLSPQWRVTDLSKTNLSSMLQVLGAQLEGGPERQKWVQRRRLGMDLLDTAYDMRFRQTTDLRDIVYALMGVVDKATFPDIGVDYNVPAEQTYARFAEVMARQTEDICTQFQDKEIHGIDGATVRGADGTLSSDRRPYKRAADDAQYSALALAEAACKQAMEGFRCHDIEEALRHLETARTMANAAMFDRPSKQAHLS